MHHSTAGAANDADYYYGGGGASHHLRAAFHCADSTIETTASIISFMACCHERSVMSGLRLDL